MKPYAMQEGTFELPEQLHDKTLHMFSLSEGNEPSDFSLVVSREKSKHSSALEKFVREQWEKLHRSLPKVELLRHENITVGGQPAIDLEFTWVSEGTPLHQRQIYLGYHGAILTFTGTAKMKMRLEWEAFLQSVINSFQFRN